MTDRRPLIDGLTPPQSPDPVKEHEFVYGTTDPVPPPAAAAPAPQLPARQHRSPISTRIRADYAEALKRASLDRQLKGEHPYQVQDILEAALEPWLKKRGYLK